MAIQQKPSPAAGQPGEKRPEDKPIAQRGFEPAPGEVEKVDDTEGHGDRFKAVKEGRLDPELVYNGLGQVPVQAEPVTEEHTGAFIAVSQILVPEDAEFTKPVKQSIVPGEVVRGLPDEQIAALHASGAIRPQTKEEAKNEKDK